MDDPGNVVVTGAMTGAKIEYASIGATVIRCGCGDPMQHAEQGLPCPTPRGTEPLGVVSEYKRQGPLGRVVTRFLSGGRSGEKL